MRNFYSLPFMVHSSGIQELSGTPTSEDVVLNLRDIIGDIVNISQMTLSLADFSLVLDNTPAVWGTSDPMPLLNVQVSNGAGAVWALGSNADAAGQEGLTLSFGSRNLTAEQLRLRLDTSSASRICKFPIYAKTGAGDYGTNPVGSSVFIRGNILETIIGSGMDVVVNDAFTRANGAADGSATLRITFYNPSLRTYHNQEQVGLALFGTNQNPTNRDTATFDLVFDGATPPTNGTSIVRTTTPTPAKFKTRVYTLSGVLYFNGTGYVTGVNCLDALATAVGSSELNVYACVIPTSNATLVGQITIETA